MENKATMKHKINALFLFAKDVQLKMYFKKLSLLEDIKTVEKITIPKVI